MMRKIELDGTREFNPLGMKAIVLHDSEHFKILNFNLKAGALFPIHSHDLDGQLSILVIEGEGLFLADKEQTICEKIRSLYPDIGQCGLDVKVRWNEPEKTWLVHLEKGTQIGPFP